MHHFGMSCDIIIFHIFKDIKIYKKIKKNVKFQIKRFWEYGHEFLTTDLLRVTLVSVKKS